MTKANVPQYLQTQDWARMPKPGDKYQGMSRTTLLEIIQNPESGVRSAVIRKPGRTRGLRLIFVPSLLAYLDRLSGDGGDSGFRSGGGYDHVSFEKRKPSAQPRNRGFRKRFPNDHYLNGETLASRVEGERRYGQRRQT